MGSVHKYNPGDTPLFDALRAVYLSDDQTEHGPEQMALTVGTPAGMDANTLAEVMGTAGVNYVAYVGPFNQALRIAQCTTVNRIAMFCAQVGHESLGLFYMQELASGAAYNGRTDLGNTQLGDGPRFKGRGPIQLTGRNNYGAFSQWCRQMGLVDSGDYFVRNPTLVATAQWGFLAAAWYWTVARPKLNSYADAGDILAATKVVNGGTNGLNDRTSRWNHARTMGDRLLPEQEDVMASLEDVRNVIRQELAIIARRDDLGFARNQVLAALGSSDPEHAPVKSTASKSVQQQLDDLYSLAAALQADVAALKAKWAP